jgi:WhiB family transcriptional regulator, redox-sensing transcriptional regulator
MNDSKNEDVLSVFAPSNFERALPNMNEKWRKIIAHLDTVNRADHTWRNKAECKGMDTNLFMPERGETTAARLAIKTCATCSVRWNCLMAGMDERIGVWGGLSERQRRQLRPHWNRHNAEQAEAS